VYLWYDSPTGSITTIPCDENSIRCRITASLLGGRWNGRLVPENCVRKRKVIKETCLGIAMVSTSWTVSEYQIPGRILQHGERRALRALFSAHNSTPPLGSYQADISIARSQINTSLWAEREFRSNIACPKVEPWEIAEPCSSRFPQPSSPPQTTQPQSVAFQGLRGV
jgi:hypothetical protein